MYFQDDEEDFGFAPEFIVYSVFAKLPEVVTPSIDVITPVDFFQSWIYV